MKKTEAAVKALNAVKTVNGKSNTELARFITSRSSFGIKYSDVWVGKFLNGEVEFSERTAKRYADVAKIFEVNAKLGTCNLKPTGLPQVGCRNVHKKTTAAIKNVKLNQVGKINSAIPTSTKIVKVGTKYIIPKKSIVINTNSVTIK